MCWFCPFLGVYKASEARLLLLMYQVNYVNQGTQLKDSAISPAKIIDDSWTMDGFVSLKTKQWLKGNDTWGMAFTVLNQKQKIKTILLQCHDF